MRVIGGAFEGDLRRVLIGAQVRQRVELVVEVSGVSIRLSRIQTPEGNVDYTYLCDTKVDSITRGTESITYGYDGPLVTSETFAGTLAQTLSHTYNSDFLLDGFTYAASLTGYGYDDDGLLTSSGPFSVSRNAGNGLPEAVTGGTLSLTRSFNGYGEVDAEGFTVNEDCQ